MIPLAVGWTKEIVGVTQLLNTTFWVCDCVPQPLSTVTLNTFGPAAKVAIAWIVPLINVNGIDVPFWVTLISCELAMFAVFAENKKPWFVVVPPVEEIDTVGALQAWYVMLRDI